MVDMCVIRKKMHLIILIKYLRINYWVSSVQNRRSMNFVGFESLEFEFHDIREIVVSLEFNQNLFVAIFVLNSAGH